MLTSVYKYLAIVGVFLVIIVGVGIYEHHDGYSIGIGDMAKMTASLNAKAATDLQAALAQQQAADAARLKAAESAQAQAQAAAQTAQATLQSQQAQIRGLTDVTDKTWLQQPIPGGVLSILRQRTASRH